MRNARRPGRNWVFRDQVSRSDHTLRTARAAVEAEARIVGFAGRSGNMTSWQMMTTLARHWTAIENQIASAPSGPWWLRVSGHKTGLLSYRA